MLKVLKGYPNYQLPKEVLDHLARFDFKFNPSFSNLNGINYLAIRLCKIFGDEIEAYLFKWAQNTDVQILNLSEFSLEKYDIKKVADPKLFIINKIVFCTFNTGYSKELNNKVLLCEINDFNNLRIKQCLFGNRNVVEKNWSFFEKNGKLFSLYSLNPLIILESEFQNEHQIIFREFCRKKIITDKYTIGTQLLQLHDNTFFFVAHKKVSIQNKRSYFGIPFIFDSQKLFLRRTHSHLLIDSLKSLIGSKVKFNKNLISCTYFSGCANSDGNIILSYGINDVSMRIVKVPKNILL